EAVAQNPPVRRPAVVAIRAGRLIDGRGPPLTDAVIVIDGERITAVGAQLPIPSGARVIDLSRMTVLPGLIDVHTHITSEPKNFYEDTFRRSAIDVAVLAHVYARRTL